MPGVLQQPNLLNLPDWVKTANIQDGAVTLAKLANLANATIIGRNTAGTGVPEAVTMSQLVELFETALEANALDWTVLQSFLAGMRLTPGAALSGPLEGTLWYELTGGRLMIRDATGSIPLMEFGSWTPTLRPDTIGDFAVAYTTNTGTYVKMGRRVWIDLNIVTSSITWTTASGTLRILGLPYTMSTASGQLAAFPLHTMAGLSLSTAAGIQMPMVAPATGGTTQLLLRRFVAAVGGSSTGSLGLGSGSGVASGTNITLIGGGYIGRTNEA
jgi:hypothetical protein